MSAPPGAAPASTSHRGESNRAIRRVVSDRAYALARRAGVVLQGRTVRELAQAFIDAGEQPTDEAIIERLMQQVPGGKKTHVKQWRVGDAHGPWAVTS